MSDGLDQLVRDACSVGPAGAKSEYRKRINRYVAAELRKEWEDMLIDARGNEEAGWKPSRSWFMQYAKDRIEQLKEEKKNG